MIGGNIPVMFQVIREFVFKVFPPYASASCAITERVSGLNHKLRNDTVEDYTIVVTALRMPGEILDSLRRLLREQSEMNITLRRVNSRGRCQRSKGIRRWCSSGDGLFFARWSFIEYVTVTRLVIPAKQLKRATTPKLAKNTYSGWSRVNI